MWVGLRAEITDMFARCEGFLGAECAGDGYGEEKGITLVRATTHELLSLDEKKARRKALEKRRAPQRAELELRRRAYKTAKQREYDAKRRAA